MAAFRIVAFLADRYLMFYAKKEGGDEGGGVGLDLYELGKRDARHKNVLMSSLHIPRDPAVTFIFRRLKGDVLPLPPQQVNLLRLWTLNACLKIATCCH